ncbi:MAG TPA: inositol monophosphatase family protein, partial [Methylomirabilota bacterium]|nr:inositol monophosphatase family protein [Methylomirabilota bacterium]
MIRAAEAAGEVAMKYYRGGFEVTIKADQTPVTQADREAEQAIKAVLRRAYPDHGFLGEELGEEGPKEHRFIIDPIDGTKNFIRRVPIWAVLLGLEEAGEITAGVMLNPA